MNTGTFLGLALAGLVAISPAAFAAEKLKIGEETIEPGIKTQFVAETRDAIVPAEDNPAPPDTDIHLEALVNWSDSSPPVHELRGQFVPYLSVSALIVDEQTGKEEDIDLLPHLSASDGLHYARNVKLPGADQDRYTVTFTIAPPEEGEADMNYHSDWVKKYGAQVFAQPADFTYKNLDFTRVIHSRRD